MVFKSGQLISGSRAAKTTMGRHVTMLLLTLIVLLYSSSGKFLFRGIPKPQMKAETVWEAGKKVVKHADKVADVASLAFSMANVDPDGWVNWKNLKKMFVPDLKKLQEKIVSYGPKLEHLFILLDDMESNIKSEKLLRTNLTNVVGKIQKSIKMANSSALKTWSTVRKLQGMSFKNEVLGGLGAAGSSCILFFVILASYIKYKAKMELKKSKKMKKLFSAMVRNYMEDQQPQNERFMDVTDEVQLVRPLHAQISAEITEGAQAQFQESVHQQETVDESAQQKKSKSFVSKIF